MRRLFIVFALIGFGSGLFSGPLWAVEILDGIKGRDDRMVMPSDEYPWRAIGRINTETGGHCTGVIVGPALVVTAAHCLYDKRKAWYVPASQVHFVAGFRDGKFAAHSVAKNYFIPNGYDELAKPSQRTALFDWAIVQLAEAIGYQTGWLGVRTAGLDENFVQAGYSKDSKTVLTAHMGCQVLSQNKRDAGDGKKLAQMVHRCDAVPGDSGSPIFYYHDGKPYLAAIHVATTKKQRPVTGIAVPVSTFIRGITQLGGGAPAEPEGGATHITQSVQILLGHLGYADAQAFYTDMGLDRPEVLDYAIMGHLIEAMGGMPRASQSPQP